MRTGNKGIFVSLLLTVDRMSLGSLLQWAVAEIIIQINFFSPCCFFKMIYFMYVGILPVCVCEGN